MATIEMIIPPMSPNPGTGRGPLCVHLVGEDHYLYLSGGPCWTQPPTRHVRTDRGLRRLARRFARTQALVSGGLHAVHLRWEA